jgi:pimeloyl-ACP methyl ester carboxylesterase
VSGPDAVDAFLEPFRADLPAAVEQFARGLLSDRAEPALVARVVADMVVFPREIALGSLQYALNRQPPLLSAMSQIDAPIFAINPDIDAGGVESLQRHGVETIVLADVGHFLMLEAPERFDEALSRTLRTLTR